MPPFAWHDDLRRRRLLLRHRLALRQGCDGRSPDRALLVVQKTLTDRDAVGGVMVHHLESDAFPHRQAMQVQCDVAVDVAEALVTGVGEGAGEIRGYRYAYERRQRCALDEGAHFAHPQPSRTHGAHRASYRAGGPFTVHA